MKREVGGLRECHRTDGTAAHCEPVLFFKNREEWPQGNSEVSRAATATSAQGQGHLLLGFRGTTATAQCQIGQVAAPNLEAMGPTLLAGGPGGKSPEPKTICLEAHSPVDFSLPGLRTLVLPSDFFLL
jgi:hypothetical protein